MTIQNNEKAFVLCADENYAAHAGTCIFSLLLSTEKRDFDVVIITNGVGRENHMRFASLGRVFGVNTKIYDGRRLAESLRSIADASRQYRLSHITDSTLLRLFYDKLVDKIYERIAYIDCDMICQGDAVDLFSVDLASHIIGAAPDLITNKGYQNSSPGQAYYFNAGTLIINDKSWRECLTSDTMKSILLATSPDKLTYADQDILNIHFSKHGYAPIGYEYNYQFMATLDSILAPKCLELGQAKIIHFAGEIKPWHAWAPVQYRSLYDKYRTLSPWRTDYKPQTPSTLRQLSLAHRCLANQGRHKEAYLASQELNNILSKSISNTPKS